MFQSIDDDGNRASIGSEHVNDYLREISGQDFSAKDFRTWAGTIAAAETSAAMEACQSATKAERNVVEAVKQVSRRLGNGPATCRKYYIHLAILDAYLTGVLVGSIDPQELPSNGKPHAAGVSARRQETTHLVYHFDGRPAALTRYRIPLL